MAIIEASRSDDEPLTPVTMEPDHVDPARESGIQKLVDLGLTEAEAIAVAGIPSPSTE